MRIKRTVVILAVIAAVICLCACGGDKKKNASITSNGRFVQSTVNGKTNTRDDFSLIDEKNLPAFKCSDGKTCVFSLNGKSHKGYVSEKDGIYLISFDDTDRTMQAVIEDKLMTLTNDKGTVTIIFAVE